MSGQVMSLAFFISVLYSGWVDFIAYAKKSHLVISCDLHPMSSDCTEENISLTVAFGCLLSAMGCLNHCLLHILL